MNALSLSPQDLHPPLAREQRERKYLPDADTARTLWRIASHHLRPEHRGGEAAYSRTTYFDTTDLGFYRARGPVRRRVRVREYSIPSEPDDPPVFSGDCFLELKETAGTARIKHRVQISPDEVAAHLARWSPAPLSPCVATWYRRRALVDDGGRLRLTLDDRILLCRPQPIGSAFGSWGADRVLVCGPELILETKLEGTPPAWLAEALSDLHEVTGFSKFTFGMNAAIQAGSSPPSGRSSAEAG